MSRPPLLVFVLSFCGIALMITALWVIYAPIGIFGLGAALLAVGLIDWESPKK